jgi:hypothetical protein
MKHIEFCRPTAKKVVREHACSFGQTRTANRVTDCVMDVADCSTDVARALTCGAATEQHYT